VIAMLKKTQRGAHPLSAVEQEAIANSTAAVKYGVTAFPTGEISTADLDAGLGGKERDQTTIKNRPASAA
jgi:hypothetical protein